MYLEKINSPSDIKSYSLDEMKELAKEMRTALLKKLSIHGGHCGPNFGLGFFCFAIFCSILLSYKKRDKKGTSGKLIFVSSLHYSTSFPVSLSNFRRKIGYIQPKIPFLLRVRAHARASKEVGLFISCYKIYQSCIVNLSKINSLINIDNRYSGTKKELFYP